MFEMSRSRAFQKRIIFVHFLQTFYYQTGFCNFLADSKSRALELSNDVSFVIFGHQACNLEWGGGQLDPPHPAYPGF